jgi:cysteine synthase
MAEMTTLLLDGHVTRSADAPRAFGNRAFLVADGCFESMRFTGGRVPFLSLHVQRLHAALSAHGMNVPASLQESNLRDAIATWRATWGTTGDMRLRLTAFRSGTGTYTPETDDVTWVATAATIDGEGFRLPPKGLDVDIYQDFVKHPSPLSKFKNLALACIVKGYKLICTTNCKQSKEKVDVLRAMGAEVHVCPTAVAPDHPDSYYSVAEKLHNEIPNSVWCNQYDNLANREAHYRTTGPEIWKQTEGKITHFIVGVGTGGTISGTAKYLKEQNPDIQIWGIDTYGSVFKKYHETGEFDENEIHSYITEGIGEDILPANVDFSLIDHFEKVTDEAGAHTARELAKKEGLLLGYSCGSAFQGLRQLKERLKPADVPVVLFHDHGSRYTGKVYNDDWMREQGWLK